MKLIGNKQYPLFEHTHTPQGGDAFVHAWDALKEPQREWYIEKIVASRARGRLDSKNPAAGMTVDEKRQYGKIHERLDHSMNGWSMQNAEDREEQEERATAARKKEVEDEQGTREVMKQAQADAGDEAAIAEVTEAGGVAVGEEKLGKPAEPLAIKTSPDTSFGEDLHSEPKVQKTYIANLRAVFSSLERALPGK